MKICCVFNYNSHYRLPIYKAMDDAFECDFFFGDNVFQPLKQFDPYLLKGFKGYIHAKITRIGARLGIGSIWHSHIIKIFNPKYTHFIITGSHTYAVNWLICYYAKLTGKKVWMWTHGMKSSPLFRTDYKRISRFYRLCDGYLMYNHYYCQFTKELGVDEKKMFVIHNTLNTPLQTSLYKKTIPSSFYQNHFGNNNPTVIYIGRLQKSVKLDLLFDAIEFLYSDGKSVNLVLVGPESPDYNIKSIIETSSYSSNIWLYGPSYNEQENSVLLYNADVCVSPGTIGLTAIHSLSYGTPVITHNNFSNIGPEFESIKEGITGSFFQEDNCSELARKISLWIGLSEEQRDNVRKEARKTIEEEWSIDYQMSVLRAIFC